MSILPDVVSAFGRRLLAKVLPQSCLLCGADSLELLCPGCREDLPRLPAECCPQCAQAAPGGERCGSCIGQPPHFERTFAVFRYRFPVDRLVHALKYGHRLAVAAWFGEALAAATAEAEADCVLPLPLHDARLRERGFNQATEIARTLATLRRLPLAGHLLHRRRATAPQATLALAKRAGNVRGAFECPLDLGGRRVLLVDDVMTSGATLDEAARTLKLHGARRVEVAVVARALRD